MEYVARAPAPSLASIVDDLYYLAGTPPYPRLTIPPMPTGYLDLRRRFAAEHPGSALDVGLLPAV